MGDEDRPLDLDELGLGALHERVEIPRCQVEVLIGGDEDIGQRVGHLTAPSLRSGRMVVDQPTEVSRFP